MPKLAAGAIAAAILSTAAPVLADAVTYEGTIGDIPVVVELSTELGVPGPELFGRYFYPRKGVDIPLRAVERDDGKAVLAEEKPCTEETCAADIHGSALEPLLGALWDLETSDDGETIIGEWAEDDTALEVNLKRVGSRAFTDFESGPEGLATASLDALWSGGEMSVETLPYDTLKMTSVENEVAEATIFGNGAIFTYEVDPRTKFQFPRIVGLGNDSDAGPANHFLEQRHWAMNADALNCSAKIYPGMGWNMFFTDTSGSLGYWDEEYVVVTYLSPTVMSWIEAGSLYCSGAHPYNHRNFHNLDVRTGQPLERDRIFADWDAVIALVLAKRTPGEAAFEADCETEQLIRDYLTISFKDGDRVLFGLSGLPHVIQACGDDVWEVPIADLKELLTHEAAEYFPSLNG